MASVEKDSKFTRSPCAFWMYINRRDYKLILWFHGH